MAKSKSYDLLVIGSGPGGYVAAIRAAQLGLSCALVEKSDRFGGTCLNIGCIPSKALLDSSELYMRLRAGGEEGIGSHGIEIGGVELDLQAMMARKRQVVEKLTSGVGRLLQGNGVRTLRGIGRLLGRGRIEVSVEGQKQTLEAANILLATGSVPAWLPNLPAGEEGFISSAEALSLEAVPDRMAVIGAGVIGLELGSVWSRLGARVTVIELLDSILPGMDAEMGRRLRGILGRQGMQIVTGTRILGFERQGRGVVLLAQGQDGTEQRFDADLVLVAVGRRPYSEGLGLPEAGVKTEAASGRVLVNGSFQTSAAGVYAIGDLIPGPMLAHKAEEEGMAVAEILAGSSAEVRYDTIPSVVYTWPELASVGKSEEALKLQGVEYRKGSFPFRVNGRALAMGSEEGMVKILADRRTDRVLGAHILGPWASDLISEVVTVMEFGGSAEDIARTVHAHPTLPEAVREAAMGVDGRSIHLLSRKRA
jgi:dihydrolipoamide dehydrogenase